MHRYALFAAVLGLSATAAHAAATNWTATCATKDENTVWFVVAQAAVKDAAPNPDFSCKGLFFDTVACTDTLAVGKIKQVSTWSALPVFELRYMPSGETGGILTFMDKVAPGVLYKPKGYVEGGQPLTTTREELFSGWLKKRREASAPTMGVTIHVWICPEGDFAPEDDEITPYGMKLTAHTGKAPT